jgi:hypothetical protein
MIIVTRENKALAFFLEKSHNTMKITLLKAAKKQVKLKRLKMLGLSAGLAYDTYIQSSNHIITPALSSCKIPLNILGRTAFFSKRKR